MWSKISNYCKNFLPIHFLNIAFIFIHNLWWVLCSDIRIFAWTVPTNKLYPLAPLQRLCPDLKPNLEGSYSKQKLTTILKLGVMKVFIRQLQSYFIIANFWVNESECENSFVFATFFKHPLHVAVTKPVPAGSSNAKTLPPPSRYRDSGLSGSRRPSYRHIKARSRTLPGRGSSEALRRSRSEPYQVWPVQIILGSIFLVSQSDKGQFSANIDLFKLIVLVGSGESHWLRRVEI